MSEQHIFLVGPMGAGKSTIGRQLASVLGDHFLGALVQPALVCGYRFEDDDLVDEMLSAVSDERGALPLLAFTASQLWEPPLHS